MKRGGYYDAQSEYQQRVAASGSRSPDEALDAFCDELRPRSALDPEWSMFEDWTLTVALTRTP
ncbi:MAG TPA: hypothetical protein VGU73_08725 [Acidimicrobiia bacterium]|nr:hypothetical protein [Acidimicrobiia bacterium]